MSPSKVDAADGYARTGNQAGSDDSPILLGDYKTDPEVHGPGGHRPNASHQLPKLDGGAVQDEKCHVGGDADAGLQRLVQDVEVA
ncbi:hypothetical protein [Streptomyces massasporeus]|uniref:hypothetical protein n=1 Tax=Streptomyces massasporeus TaxID=67324 RepID=UPI00382D6C45